MTTSLRTAVIGVGHLGQYHAEKLSNLSTLVAVCDTIPDNREKVAKRHNVLALSDYTQLAGQVDAVTIVTPTQTHAAIAEFFLKRGVHVLLEKPMTYTSEQAEALIKLAKQADLILQVGHIERFNSAFIHVNHPKEALQHIQATRSCPFKERGTHVSVILDMMIHDIDLVLYLQRHASLEKITCTGKRVRSQHIDIAQAHLHFSDGCVAELTADRVNPAMTRTLTLTQSKLRQYVDFQEKTIRTITLPEEGEHTLFQAPQTDALHAEISDFLHCILRKKQPVVDGTAGLIALRLALNIEETINKQRNATCNQH